MLKVLVFIVSYRRWSNYVPLVVVKAKPLLLQLPLHAKLNHLLWQPLISSMRLMICYGAMILHHHPRLMVKFTKVPLN